MSTNPDTDQFWIIDYRIFALDDDGNTKLDHVQEMLYGVLNEKALPVTTVLMDTWLPKGNCCSILSRWVWSTTVQ